jgi:hypothetical protein
MVFNSHFKSNFSFFESYMPLLIVCKVCWLHWQHDLDTTLNPDNKNYGK